MELAGAHSQIRFGAENRQRLELPVHAMPDVYGKFYDFSTLQSDLNPDHLIRKTWSAEGLHLFQTQNAASIVERSKSKSEESSGLLNVHRYFGGQVHGFLDDANIDRFPGHIYVADLSRRVKCVQFPNMIQGMFITKSSIGYRCGEHMPVLKFSMDTTMGAVLYAQFDKVFSQLHQHDQLDRVTYAQLIAQLKMALGTDHHDQDVRSLARDSLRDLIQKFIERHLTAPDLSITSILKEFGVSRASLFRMFEEDGGVRNYINNRRLHRAVLEISRKPLPRGAITLAAEKWGFSSNANFNRSVRRAFGANPSSLVYSNPIGTHDLGVNDTPSPRPVVH